MSINDVNIKLTLPLVTMPLASPPPSPPPKKLDSQLKAKTDNLQFGSSKRASGSADNLALKVAQAQLAENKENKGFFDIILNSIGDGFNEAIDWTEKQVEESADGAADLMKDVPVLGSVARAAAWTETQTAQLVGGVFKGAGFAVGGFATVLLHPIDAVKGLYSLVEHIPLLPANPLKLLSGAYDVAINGQDLMVALNRSLNPSEVLKDDAEFGKALLNDMIEPYRKSIDEGKWAEAIGLGVFDIGSFFVGGGEVKAGAKAAKVAEVAETVSKLAKAKESFSAVLDFAATFSASASNAALPPQDEEE